MFEGEDRYARNDLKLWLEAHGAKGGGDYPRSNATSPPKSPRNKRGGEEKDEGGGGGRHAIETGTA